MFSLIENDNLFILTFILFLWFLKYILYKTISIFFHRINDIYSCLLIYPPTSKPTALERYMRGNMNALHTPKGSNPQSDVLHITINLSLIASKASSYGNAYVNK